MIKIGIVGNGFVGSALAGGFILHTEDILIFDVNKAKSTHSFEDVINKIKGYNNFIVRKISFKRSDNSTHIYITVLG